MTGLCSRSAARVGVGVILALCAGAPAPLDAQPQLPLDSALVRWVRTHALAMKPVDDPYRDEDYAFLRPLIGNARLLAIGENIHGGHEPLQLRNQIIRYAVTQLGFTVVAIESGFTEGIQVDRFVQGGEGNVDSVAHYGISYGFGDLRENRELVQWLREYNQTATTKVRFYGIDQTGVGDPQYSGAPAVHWVLDYLARADASLAASARARLTPLLGGFAARTYPSQSADAHDALRRELQSLDRLVTTARSRLERATSRHEYALARRNTWAALRLEQSFRISGAEGPRALSAIRLRDSVMAENTKWALEQSGPSGKAIVFAHNGHSMSVPMTFPAMAAPVPMMGQRLREAFGTRMRTIGMAASRFTDMGTVPEDISSFEVAMVRAGTPNYAIDLRTSDRFPQVGVRLRQPWITRIHAWFQPMVPRDVADIFLVLGDVRRTPPIVAQAAGAAAPAGRADSLRVVMANRVEFDVNAPAAVVWSFLPSIRSRPNMTKVVLNGVVDAAGSRFDTIFRDSVGTVSRHDRLEVLHWEPGRRYAAHITTLPPAPPMEIVYNVELRERDGVTHFVMDAYATVWIPDAGSDASRQALYTARRREFQEGTSKAYEGLKLEMEAAAKR